MEYLIEALQPHYLFWLVVGVVLGAVMGCIPGLGPTLGVALLSPLTFGMDATAALLMIGGLYCSSIWGGSISAILINAPGTGGSCATAIDGYPMTQKGLAKTALGISLTASTLSGIVGITALIFLAPPLARIGLAFGPSEYLLLCVFALMATATVGSNDLAKGMLGTALGLLITSIGIDLIIGYPRFVFNYRPLVDGISFIPALIGLFAMAEAFRLATLKVEIGKIKGTYELGGSYLEGILFPFKKWLIMLRSAAIGAFIGALPGAGIAAANFLSYMVEVRSSKHPEEYGTGKMEGLLASEGANDAVKGGSLIPTFSLGIPGNPVTAVMLGTLMMHGLRPGPRMFVDSPDIIYTLFAGFFLANFVQFIVGFGLMSQFARIVTLPRGLLVPLICIMSFTGAYLMRREPLDIIIVLIFGILGWFLKVYKIPSVTVVMGMILGALIERNLFRALVIVDHPLEILYISNITIVLTILIIVVMLIPVYPKLKRRFFNKDTA